MCEFKVFKKVDGEERSIAVDIVRFGIEDGRLALYDIVGSREVLDDSLVSGLNVGRERIDILQAPGIGKLLAFVDAYSEAYASQEYDDRLEVAWNDVKRLWDENLVRLRDTCAGVQGHAR